MISKSRIKNYTYLDVQMDLIGLLRTFRVMSFSQIHLYQARNKRVDFRDRDKTREMLVNLAYQYHLHIDQGKELYARKASDITGESNLLSPFWVYFDFYKIGCAGCVESSEIPYTPVLFEKNDTCDVLEVVNVPCDPNEVLNLNMELMQYDRTVYRKWQLSKTGLSEEEMERATARKRIVILPDIQYAGMVQLDHVYLFCTVDKSGRVVYYTPDTLCSQTDRHLIVPE